MSDGSPTAALRDGRATGTWVLDPGASTVEVAVKHFWGLMTVRGRLVASSGRADVAADGTVSAALELDAGSIDTGNAKRDEHLRSDDFFDAAAHPTVSFTTGQVALVGDDRASVTGTLTAAGHAEPVELDAVLSSEGDRARVDATGTVDRTRFGMTWSPMRMAAPNALVTLGLTFRRSSSVED